MGVFELHNAKKYCWGSGVALQTPIPLYPLGQKRCFWIPGMGVFETNNGQKYCLGSGVAPQTPVPLHTMGQKGCFWIPRMGVFEFGDLVQRYARLERHAKSPRVLALRISDTPMLGIQRHFGGHIWCRGMRAWSATPKAHLFGIAHFRHPHARYPKNTLAGRFGAEVCALGAPRQKPTFLALRISDTPVPGIQKHFCGQIWCRFGLRAWSATPNAHVFWHCAFQIPPY